MQCESILIVLDTGSHSPENSDLPTPSLPESRGATVKIKKGTVSSKKNLRSAIYMCVIVLNYRR